MLRSRTPSQMGGSQRFEMERKYSVPSNPESRAFSGTTSEDLHAWSIYRQNLNSDFTDSALGSTDKSPLPYGNFQLRDTTVQSILSHPRYGPKSALGANMYTYLKFGLPRVFPPNGGAGSHHSSASQQHPHSSRQHFRNASSRSGRHLHQNHHQRNGRLKTGGGGRDGSSGYDSSDNEPNHHHNHHFAAMKHSRKYRSDPDFRNLHHVQSYARSSPDGHRGHQKRPSQQQLMLLKSQQQQQQQWNRNKSNSEANLLSDHHYHQRPISGGAATTMDVRRNSIADFGVTTHRQSTHLQPTRKRPPSEATVLEVIQPVSAPSPPIDFEDPPIFVYPNLQAIGVSVWPNTSLCCCQSADEQTCVRGLLLSDVTFEVRGGELLAIMATNEREGTTLLDLIAGRRTPLAGEFLLNGQRVRSSALRKRIAYAQNNPHLAEDMTAAQTLRYHLALCRPTEKLAYLKIGNAERINVLIEELGLEQVRDTKVAHMTSSERRRLNVACHLLLDTDIVVLDQPTRGMDIFDTFFLVEYLRHWACGGSATPTNAPLGRIVILTLHPPTYEIFTMLSKIVLLSAGRTMFSGGRREMLPYFAQVEYPCPAFKNPSDYYLDLVTLDDLSAEAMLESSQRIEQLAELFHQRQLNGGGELGGGVGGVPPGALPMTVSSANWLQQMWAIFTKSMVYTQPNTFIAWLTVIVIAASLSLITGAIFWDVPQTDSQLNLNDRHGYHFAVMSVMSWPLLFLLTVVEAWRNRRTVERDIQHGLYGRFTYLVTKTVIQLLPSLLVWLVYLVPSHAMTGLYMQSVNDHYDGFYVYVGVMLLYLMASQQFLTSLLYLLPTSTTEIVSNCSIILAATALAVLCWPSGYLVHFHDLPRYLKILQCISPNTWLMLFLLNRDLSPESILATHSVALCRNKQVQRQDIIVQSACPPPNGTQILFNYGYLPSQSTEHYSTYANVPVAIIVFYAVCCLIGLFAFCCCNRQRRFDMERQYQTSNRP